MSVGERVVVGVRGRGTQRSARTARARSALAQGRLVAKREMRERSRSRGFRASLGFMLVVVVGIVVVPAMLDSGPGPKDIGLTGVVPDQLARTIADQRDALGETLRVRTFADAASGERALRDGEIDALVVDGTRLEWRRRTDDQLRSVLTGAIQLVAVQERAAAGGISQAALSALVAPVPVDNVELGSVAGRSPDDETAVMVMTILLFVAISTYGNLVLTGVVEEKASRVVEVLLSRMPARTLLAGKVAGIGLLGLAQFALTALVAFAALATVDSIDVPAISGTVLAWVVVWFVLGYALYAMVYGALGSLASRAEDAQSVAGPVTAVLVAGYFASFVSTGRPDSVAAKALSFFPVTAPLSMPNRIAMGATSWWEPILAVVLTLVAIAALVQLGGRVYAGAALHTGRTLRLRDAWRDRVASRPVPPTAAR